MPFESSLRRPAGPLSQRLELATRAGSEAPPIDRLFASVWQQLEAALTPIIGTRGMAALLGRSLHLSVAQHALLSLPPDTKPTALADAVAQALARHPDEHALAAGDALLQTFRVLLASLVGVSLTDRLLLSVWAAPEPSSSDPSIPTSLSPSGPTAQDPSP
jgi:hypothetical protein